MITIKCCKNCTTETGRHPGCHAECEKYISEKAEAVEDEKAFKDDLMKLVKVDKYYKDTRLRWRFDRERRNK